MCKYNVHKPALMATIFVLTACANPDVETSHGLDVWGYDNQATIETATELVLQARAELTNSDHNGRQSLRGLRVFFQDHIDYPGSGENLAGYYSHQESALYINTLQHDGTPWECFARNAFQHELAHHLQYVIERTLDYAHIAPRYWAEPVGVVYYAQTRAIEALCQ